MQNTIVYNNNAIKIASTQLPFSNNFVCKSVKLQKYNGVDELHCVVVCTNDSHEPLRMYFCAYSMTGELLACNTLN